jgi:hypothetical protein
MQSCGKEHSYFVNPASKLASQTCLVPSLSWNLLTSLGMVQSRLGNLD